MPLNPLSCQLPKHPMAGAETCHFLCNKICPRRFFWGFMPHSMLLVDVQGSQKLSNSISPIVYRPSKYLFKRNRPKYHVVWLFFFPIFCGYVEGRSGFQQNGIVAPSRTPPRFGFDMPSTSFVPHTGCPRSQGSVHSAVNPVRVESVGRPRVGRGGCWIGCNTQKPYFFWQVELIKIVAFKHKAL